MMNLEPMCQNGRTTHWKQLASLKPQVEVHPPNIKIGLLFVRNEFILDLTTVMLLFVYSEVRITVTNIETNSALTISYKLEMWCYL